MWHIIGKIVSRNSFKRYILVETAMGKMPATSKYLASSRPVSRTPSESALREKLGIPHDAKQILIFTETSHWDPNWLYTSRTYFRLWVRRQLNQAVKELVRDERRVYGIECVFFLRMYFEDIKRHGEIEKHQDLIRQLVNQGRLRMFGSGVTTPDTTIPSGEALIRDFLVGQEWLRNHGMFQEPSVAYFPDSFGHSPALGSILNALGIHACAITRIDGMYFLGCDLETPSHFPRPGSSAEVLKKKQRSLDFIWKGPNNAELLCHWNAFSYGQGELLAHKGFTRGSDVPLAISERSEDHVAKRIEGYANRLFRYSKTPYALCPIGYDFSRPIHDLLELLDRYNNIRYPHTGLWVVNAGLDDYLGLVGYHKDGLDVVELDPNPCWSGFYTSRSAIKERGYKLCCKLIQAEQLLVENKFGSQQPPVNKDAHLRLEYPSLTEKLQDVWYTLATANHHDFITGTSPDRVVKKEQLPWLDKALDEVQDVIGLFDTADGSSNVANGRSVNGLGGNNPLGWHQEGNLTVVETSWLRFELDQSAGGTIVKVADIDSGEVVMGGYSNNITDYFDSGGLWRMGNEYLGGRFDNIGESSVISSELDIKQVQSGILQIQSFVYINGQPVQTTMWFYSDVPLVKIRTVAIAASRHTLSSRFVLPWYVDSLTMDVPGGVINRPAHKLYTPTFWSAQSFVDITNPASLKGISLLIERPSAIALSEIPTVGTDHDITRADIPTDARPSQLEVIVARNASKERVFGFLPIPAHPALGHNWEPQIFNYAVAFTKGDNRLDKGLAERLFKRPNINGTRDIKTHLITSNDPDVKITAIKPAWRGEGIIVRIYLPKITAKPTGKVHLSLNGITVNKAFLSDALERDISPLEIKNNMLSMPIDETYTTVRLL
ncbi:MAG: hypothetical protein M1483_01175 [Actinobacteria bacterium]|nr:hypothetical protein [Actinomycetota bacterium]MCL6104247.1 hypothetical protein [Actinomycetota bacterium]